MNGSLHLLILFSFELFSSVSNKIIIVQKLLDTELYWQTDSKQWLSNIRCCQISVYFIPCKVLQRCATGHGFACPLFQGQGAHEAVGGRLSKSSEPWLGEAACARHGTELWSTWNELTNGNGLEQRKLSNKLVLGALHVQKNIIGVKSYIVKCKHKFLVHAMK